eukprot:scaffold100439_cov16-Tisochrysis_lutea.AAC.1
MQAACEATTHVAMQGSAAAVKVTTWGHMVGERALQQLWGTCLQIWALSPNLCSTHINSNSAALIPDAPLEWSHLTTARLLTIVDATPPSHSSLLSPYLYSSPLVRLSAPPAPAGGGVQGAPEGHQAPVPSPTMTTGSSEHEGDFTHSPDFRSAARSCRKPLKGARPVPGPTMMTGTSGFEGSLKWECRMKEGTAHRHTCGGSIEL